MSSAAAPPPYRKKRRGLKVFKIQPPQSTAHGLVLPLDTYTWEYSTASYDPEMYGHAIGFDRVQTVTAAARDIVKRLVTQNKKRRLMGILAMVFAFLTFGGPWLIYAKGKQAGIFVGLGICFVIMITATILGIHYRHEYCAVIRKLDKCISKFNETERVGCWKIGDYGGWLEFRANAAAGFGESLYAMANNQSGIHENLLVNNPGALLVEGEMIVPNQHDKNIGGQGNLYPGVTDPGNGHNVAYANAPVGDDANMYPNLTNTRNQGPYQTGEYNQMNNSELELQDAQNNAYLNNSRD
mmetsp:Transcript_17855/g.20257  ORF Transcript_17855/g.20257 Transcript_17855/m.20257 type:complete len:297 (-) Transcript_17855:71-961(-)